LALIDRHKKDEKMAGTGIEPSQNDEAPKFQKGVRRFA
jgi:hypothetical protein